jgi:glycerol-3-phosphate acyltransferase PlsY
MLDFLLVFFTTAVLSYLLGSISFSVIITKLMLKTDVRNHGSGNAGATNVFRLGKFAGVVSTLGDIAKAAASVFIGWILFNNLIPQTSENAEMGKYIAGLFCMIGHIYPIYFGFRGGKGALTSAIMALLLNPLIFLIIICIWIVTIIISKMISLASVLAALSFPICVCIFSLNNQESNNKWVFIFISLIISGIVIYKHKANIVRIFKGTESKISFEKKKNI